MDLLIGALLISNDLTQKTYQLDVSEFHLTLRITILYCSPLKKCIAQKDGAKYEQSNKHL